MPPEYSHSTGTAVALYTEQFLTGSVVYLSVITSNGCVNIIEETDQTIKSCAECLILCQSSQQWKLLQSYQRYMFRYLLRYWKHAFKKWSSRSETRSDMQTVVEWVSGNAQRHFAFQPIHFSLICIWRQVADANLLSIVVHSSMNLSDVKKYPH